MLAEPKLSASGRGSAFAKAPARHRAGARLNLPRAKADGGEGGIRTHVPVTRQDAFEAPPLRPLRYLSGRCTRAKRTFEYTSARRSVWHRVGDEHVAGTQRARHLFRPLRI